MNKGSKAYVIIYKYNINTYYINKKLNKNIGFKGIYQDKGIEVKNEFSSEARKKF